MKYALVNEERREATERRLPGICPHCGAPVVAKPGTIRMKHWSHRGKLMCDRWWENETEWHRAWKGQFPAEWQEKRHQDNSTGEWHVADVKTAQEWVVEFQHSYLTIEERLSREAFYSNLIWVVDVTTREKTKARFIKALKGGIRVCTSPPIKKILFPEECALLRKWAGCRAPVFFDFGEGETPEKSTLGCLLPLGPDGGTYIVGFSRKEFINLLLGMGSQSDFDAFAEHLKKLGNIISERLADRTNLLAIPSQLRRGTGFGAWVSQEMAKFRGRL